MSVQAELSYIHKFEPGTGVPLLLLHGTGGDESDLLPLGRALGGGRPLLSPRGKVLENGMPRFFRRLAEGVLDEEDVIRRANELADFIAQARETYGIEAPVAVGYSNGANVASAMLMLRPEALAGAALLRPMPPLVDMLKAELAGKRVLVVSGAADPIAPLAGGERVARHLAACGADVRMQTVPGGHGLSQHDLVLVRDWLAGR